MSYASKLDAEPLASDITGAVMQDLRGRKGVLDGVEEAVIEEMTDELYVAVRDRLQVHRVAWGYYGE